MVEERKNEREQGRIAAEQRAKSFKQGGGGEALRAKSKMQSNRSEFSRNLAPLRATDYIVSNCLDIDVGGNVSKSANYAQAPPESYANPYNSNFNSKPLTYDTFGPSTQYMPINALNPCVNR